MPLPDFRQPDFNKIFQEVRKPLDFAGIIGQLKSTQNKLNNFRIRGLGVSGNLQHGHGYCVRPGDDCELVAEGDAGTPIFTPMGACCDGIGNCTIATQASCEDSGGVYQGDDTTCDPNPCGEVLECACAIPVSVSTTLNSSSTTDPGCTDFTGSISAGPATHSFTAVEFPPDCLQAPEDSFCNLSGCEDTGGEGAPPCFPPDATSQGRADVSINITFDCEAETVFVSVDWFTGCACCDAGSEDCSTCNTHHCSGDLHAEYTFDVTDTGLHSFTESLTDGDFSGSVDIDITLG